MGKVRMKKGTPKLRRSARNKAKGKYARQRIRTEANKARKRAKLLNKE